MFQSFRENKNTHFMFDYFYDDNFSQNNAFLVYDEIRGSHL